MKDLNALNDWFEEIRLDETDDIPTPLFIVGSPRSGTTLVYQMITHSFDVAYVSNFIARFWGNPLIGVKLQNEIYGDKEFNSSFISHHGYSKESPLEPHEFGNFWKRWFYEDENDFRDEKFVVSPDFYKTLALMQENTGKKWIFKNLTLSLKIPLLKKIFPQARFIYVKREKSSVMKSLLTGRKERFGSYDHWWSVKPKDYVNIKKLSGIEQVYHQIESINNQIEADLSRLNSDDFFIFDYEDLLGYQDTLFQQLISWGYHKVKDVPDHFFNSPSSDKDDKLDNEIRSFLDKRSNDVHS